MNNTYLDKKENKHLNALQRKYGLVDRREEVSQLNNDEKRPHSEMVQFITCVPLCKKLLL